MQALRDEVAQDPAALLPRLVLADWLEEYGEPGEAQLQRARAWAWQWIASVGVARLCWVDPWSQCVACFTTLEVPEQNGSEWESSRPRDAGPPDGPVVRLVFDAELIVPLHRRAVREVNAGRGGVWLKTPAWAECKSRERLLAGCRLVEFCRRIEAIGGQWWPGGAG